MFFTKNIELVLNQKISPNDDSDLVPESEHNKWSSNIDDYELIEQIGSGSFGRVYRYRSLQIGKECALKCVSKVDASTNLKKILSEVLIHIRLHHQNILQMYTVIEDVKNVYLVLQLCSGGSLAKCIQTRVNRLKSNNKKPINQYPMEPVLPYPIVSSIIEQICDALKYLHRNFIVHRDLNLNNILLEKPFDKKSENSFVKIKIADFGLAIDLNKKNSESSEATAFTSGDTICGTPGFISPEVWHQKQNVSYKSDIFSLGSIIFACITGYIPKGDIILDSFYPMTSKLIAKLLDPESSKRPELNEILKNIFVSGRVNSHRLFPIEKNTRLFKMKIDSAGFVHMSLVKENLSFKVNQDGLFVWIQCDKEEWKKFLFYDLPEKYWEKYLYLVKFINLVRSKTTKITVHCSEWFRNEEKSKLKEYVNKCVLMENDDFEVSLYNEVLDKSYRFLLNDESLKLPKFFQRFKSKLSKLYTRILNLNHEIGELGSELGINLFPITLGIDSKSFNEQKKFLKHSSFLSSQVLRSIQIKGIGKATQIDDGSIEVLFNDGSNLCLNGSNEIYYVENGIPRKFHKDEVLPENVLGKIAKLPQVIDHLKNS